MTAKEYFEKKKGFLGIQDCTLLLPKEQSMMLSYLIDTENWEEVKRLPEDVNYFWANKEGFIGNYFLGWSIKEITTALNKLEQNGYIDTIVKNVDMRSRTYIKINFNNLVRLDNLYEDINKAKCELSTGLTKGMLLDIKKVCSKGYNIDTLEYEIRNAIHTYYPYLYIHTNIHSKFTQSSDCVASTEAPLKNNESFNDLKDVLKRHFPNFNNSLNISSVLTMLSKYDYNTACKIINESNTINDLLFNNI